MAKKAEVNKGVCIGCGTCVSMCPDCFKLGEDNKSEFIEGCDSTKCNLEDVAESCPVSAIEVKEDAKEEAKES